MKTTLRTDSRHVWWSSVLLLPLRRLAFGFGRALGCGLHRLTFFGFVWCVGHLSLRLLVLRISVAVASGWRRRQDLVQMLLRKELHTPQEQCKKGDSTFLLFSPRSIGKFQGSNHYTIDCCTGGQGITGKIAHRCSSVLVQESIMRLAMCDNLIKFQAKTMEHQPPRKKRNTKGGKHKKYSFANFHEATGSWLLPLPLRAWSESQGHSLQSPGCVGIPQGPKKKFQGLPEFCGRLQQTLGVGRLDKDPLGLQQKFQVSKLKVLQYW